MGLFDSFRVPCPKCKKKLEFQSKSGPCFLGNYTKKDLPVEVAVGIAGDIVLCQFCNSHIKLICVLPKVTKTKLLITKLDYSYNGNYNPETPENIQRSKELAELFKKK